MQTVFLLFLIIISSTLFSRESSGAVTTTPVAPFKSDAPLIRKSSDTVDVLIAAGRLNEAAEALIEEYQKSGDAEKKKVKELMTEVAGKLSELGKKAVTAKKYQLALNHYKAALDLTQTSGDMLHSLINMSSIAECREKLHDYPGALKVYTALLELFEKLGDEHILVANILEARAGLYEKMQRPDAVLKDIKRALAIYEKLEGKRKNYEDCQESLAKAYTSLYRYDEADRELKSLLELQKASGSDAEARVASTLFELADLKRKSYRFAESEDLYMQSLKIVNRLFEKEPVRAGFILQGLGRLYQASGRFADAELVIKQNVSLYEAADSRENEYAKSLTTLADFYKYTGRFDEAVQLYGKAVELREKIFGSKSMEVFSTKNNMANLLKSSGKYQEAENLFNAILQPMTNLVGKESADVASLMDDMAMLYDSWGKYEKAEKTSSSSLATIIAIYGKDSFNTTSYRDTLADILQSQGKFAEAEEQLRLIVAIAEKTFGTQHKQYAWALRRLGKLLRNSSRYAEAENVYMQSLAIDDTVYGIGSVQTMLNSLYLGKIYAAKGESKRAEEQFLKVIGVYEAVYGKMNSEMTDALSNLAFLYMEQGRFSEAYKELERVYSINKAVYGEEHYQTSNSLANLAVFYRRTGNYIKSEEYYLKVIDIDSRFFGKESSAVASTLNNLGWLYYSMGNYKKAAEVTNKAVSIYRRFYGGDHQKFANTLTNLAILNTRLVKHDEAEHLFKTALALNQSVKFDDGWSEWGLGELYIELKRYTEALPLLKNALRIAQKENNSELTWKSQVSLSLLMERTGKIDAAIFFGKQAISTIQGVRSNLGSMGKDVQSSYQDLVSPIYKRLADMLIEQGRLPEAQQIMELLKQQEYFQYVRRDARESSNLTGSTYTMREASLDKAYQETAASLTNILKERDLLLAKRGRTPEEEARFSSLQQQYGDAAASYNKAFDAITRDMGVSRRDKTEELKEAEGLMSVLKELKQGSVAIYTLAGEKSFRLILITPRFRKAFEYAITEQELNRRIAEFRAVLADPGADPRPLAQELYRIIVAPMIADLRAAKAQTLMWSLDGALRYLPMAALYDGKQYMLQEFRNVVFTTASQANLKDQPSPSWKGLAVGVSKQHPGFAPLPSVPNELTSVVRAGSSTSGALPGTLFLDEGFTWLALEQNLRQEENYPLVHIASHFQFTPGNDTMSFLLLGDGRRLTISELKAQDGIFTGVELLTLSACNTAVGDIHNADGKEVEGFAVLAQRKGAKSVVATLWPVADTSTSLLMQQFYQLREEKKLPKIEALRQAQLALLNGTVKAVAADQQRTPIRLKEAKQTASAMTYTADPDKPFAHPYFWAPFILMGNWK